MKRVILIFFLFVVIAYFGLTKTKISHNEHLANIEGDKSKGAYIYVAAGCANCHASQGSSDKMILAGGQAFETDFGTFYAPNVSMSKSHGIGNWNVENFSAAVRDGVSPEGRHYFPAFPYTAYAKMTDPDLVDLWTFWQTLPASEEENKTHDLVWPISMRSNVGIWKLLFFGQPFVSQPNTRGAYLVEVLGHCAECHTPRDRMGALDTNFWMEGARNPSGVGKIPGITPKILNWTVDEIADYLETGFTPEFDMVGGHMASIIENLAQLSPEDRMAIATYLTNLPG